jgi:hypothetical protein
MNLADAGLFKLKDKKSPGYFDWNFEKIKESLKLINDEFDELQQLNPRDISYVYNGFSPISVRLIELFLEMQGLNALHQKGLLKLVGLTEDKIKIAAGEAKFFNPPASQPGRPAFKKKKILIYFIGGITFAEMAAIRFLQNLYPKYKFIIATTSIINGESALAQLLGPGTGPEDQGLLLGELLKK